ncbi:MAG: hypothetical protein ACM3VV_04085 [Deltaproteobacteria bacterium]
MNSPKKRIRTEGSNPTPGASDVSAAKTNKNKQREFVYKTIAADY